MDFREALYKLVGSRIKNQRIKMGFSQEDLAERVGLARASVSNIEVGRQQPTLNILYEISRFLEIDVQMLLPTYNQVNSAIADSDEPLEILKTKDIDDGSKDSISQLIKNLDLED